MTTPTVIQPRTARGQIAHSWMVVLIVIAGVFATLTFMTGSLEAAILVVVAAMPAIGFFHVMSKPDV